MVIVINGRELILKSLDREIDRNFVDLYKAYFDDGAINFDEFDEPGDPSAKMDFMKERIGIEVAFGHASFIGIDLLKFQVASYSGLDKIDVGVYVVTTKKFQKIMKEEFSQNWSGSLNYEKVIRYLPHFKSAIQLPIYVIGIDI